jgi:hypothetical protein
VSAGGGTPTGARRSWGLGPGAEGLSLLAVHASACTALARRLGLTVAHKAPVGVLGRELVPSDAVRLLGVDRSGAATSGVVHFTRDRLKVSRVNAAAVTAVLATDAFRVAAMAGVIQLHAARYWANGQLVQQPIRLPLAALHADAVGVPLGIQPGGPEPAAARILRGTPENEIDRLRVARPCGRGVVASALALPELLPVAAFATLAAYLASHWLTTIGALRGHHWRALRAASAASAAAFAAAMRR